VTRGQLPQKAESLGLNGGGAAAAVPPATDERTIAYNALCIYAIAC